MRKNKFFLVLIVLCISGVLGGCTDEKQIPVEEAKTVTKTEEKGGVFKSIRDAISQSLSIKCEYPAGEGKKVTAYIKGNLIRIDGSMTDEGVSGVIVKGNKMWTWDNTKKEGAIIVIPPTEDKNGKKEEFNSQEIIDNLEAKKEYCSQAIVTDSLFEPPADIKFTDLSDVFSKMGQSQ